MEVIKISAICGIFNIDGMPVPEKMQNVMMGRLKTYKLDSTHVWNRNNIFFGCGIQYITAESRTEVLPLFDENIGLAITADAIIDNREELLSTLHIKDEGDISDSRLIMLAYEKWGEECPKYIMGDYAFAIWDEKRKELFCARDHVGKRTFYYYFNDGTFYFCTVIKPILAAYNRDVKLNDKWIADFLSLEGVMHEIGCNETIYEDIKQLPPAHTVTIRDGKPKFNKYWNPVEVKELRLRKDEEYEEAFREVFDEAVRCRLRSCGLVGISLSGGLDSGSVACLAAKHLKNHGKSLKAFCSIPVSTYKNNLSKHLIPDESGFVEALKDYVGNIDVTYCRFEDKNSFSDIDRFLDILEQPYKIIENLYWYNGIAEVAAQNGCKVLLDGQYGNCTVSYGDFYTHVLTLYRSIRMFKMIREMRAYSRINKIPFGRVVKNTARTVLPYNFRKAVSDRIVKDRDEFAGVPVNFELAKEWNVPERFRERGYNLHPQRFYDFEETRKMIVDPASFSHISTIETKISLANGIIKRDPTRDKRVIEFCLSLPGDQYVRNGQERYLIRRAMKNMLPDEIRLNTTCRGIQAADWIQRLAPEWNKIASELEKMLGDGLICRYIDTDKLRKELRTIGDLPSEKKWYSIRMLLVSLVFYYFITSFKTMQRKTNKPE